jgi:hypothetical protein
MKAVTGELPSTDDGWAYEIKWDGMRVIAAVGDSEQPLRLETTRGLDALVREVAHRAVAIDEWSEGAYGVLVGAALAQGQLSTAHRLLKRCLAALADLGVTERTRWRVQTVSALVL